MNNLPETSVKTDLGQKQGDKPWWKRPIFGKDGLLTSLLEKLFGDSFAKFDKPSVPQNTIILHNREMMDMRVFAKTAMAIDNDKFTNAEFLLFVRLKYAVARGLDEYDGLNESIQLLQVAIEAKNSYITLDQTELRYRSSKQQEFYKFIQDLLKLEEDKTKFREKVQEKLLEVMPYIKTEEGKVAMQCYAEELDHLAEHELGLKLLSLFKAYQLADYSILRTISDLVASLKEQDVTNLKILSTLVMSKYQVFEKLGQIIGVGEKRNTPETYARMIQLITLSYRHQLSYIKFDDLLKVMRKWFGPYRAVVGIRGTYSPKEYKLPKEFMEPLVGVDIYEKYSKSLTDQKSGRVYIDFNEN